ncbi:MAG: hypothetical protein IJ733_14800 [Lachnospiraceae bacterium]|nr:hypothetical protein [Lachnospiraceae bacterium]
MGKNQAMALENECKNKAYFEYGNVRIIISEHFPENGDTMEKLVENAVLRDDRLRAENVQ